MPKKDIMADPTMSWINENESNKDRKQLSYCTTTKLVTKERNDLYSRLVEWIIMDTSGINRDAIQTDWCLVTVLLIEEEEEDADDCNDRNKSKIAYGDIVYSINDLNSEIAIIFEL